AAPDPPEPSCPPEPATPAAPAIPAPPVWPPPVPMAPPVAGAPPVASLPPPEPPVSCPPVVPVPEPQLMAAPDRTMALRYGAIAHRRSRFGRMPRMPRGLPNDQQFGDRAPLRARALLERPVKGVEDDASGRQPAFVVAMLQADSRDEGREAGRFFARE